MSSINILVNNYNTLTKGEVRHERLGQYFVNRYIKGQWPELFYESDDKKSFEMISKWLGDHQYYDQLPLPVKALVSDSK